MKTHQPLNQRAIVKFEHLEDRYKVSVTPIDRLSWRVGYAPTMKAAVELAHELAN
ncbi:hypothetical protein [Nocardia seriolae]|uniref:Uncharacterized protein n=1 Tax=Nocardia seriolae TaxID=37332 RepID=A0A0B8NEP4_9NOCA|nr:hypothetical protein [Nocardia seriolae]APA98998.1 hypothetical protein NS506_04952 [Nocardia seriolae]MTJ71284.1 hypothetical protein [Nocardia seriolae]MTJ88609.1 hypothetical protein [Nocardia seriolae]MTK41934.1 hypothetical protein [Nocardia seriolae]MTK49180.1 hypothetical protein [Nocardia seriolae]